MPRSMWMLIDFMLRLRPPRLLVDGSRLARSLQPQAQGYVTKKPPNPESSNYPLLRKIYNEYVEYSEGEKRNVYKIKAFETAISALDSLPFKVQRIQDVEMIKGIGAGMRRRIEEALVDEEEHGIIPSTSKNIKELLHSIQLFQKISGVGPKTAKKLAESGFRTLEDIMADEDTFAKLPRAIQTSMKHNSKILKQIQRDDIDRLSTLISDTLKEFDVYITGSYRRGASLSADVDVLVFHKDYQTTPQGRATTKKAQEKARNESPLLSKAVPLLTEAKVLEEPLTSGPAKWQGLVRLEPNADKLCRMDLNLMPMASRGAALVGYTGDAEFNQYLRGKAIKVGMRLNDFGLWKRPTGWKPSQDVESKDDDKNWELVPTETEQDVFEELNEGWVDPEKRNFNNLQGRRRRKSDS